jgi:isoleucyl-tRNA synthetase
MLAPVLVFTADETWEFVPGGGNVSVHEVKWEPVAFTVSEEETANWKKFFVLREEVLPELEAARKSKLIGKSLEAKATLTIGNEFAGALNAREDLRELFNVSELFVEVSHIGKQYCVVMHADGQKCERCWRWEMDVGQNLEHPTICGRCVEAVREFRAGKPGGS